MKEGTLTLKGDYAPLMSIREWECSLIKCREACLNKGGATNGGGVKDFAHKFQGGQIFCTKKSGVRDFAQKFQGGQRFCTRISGVVRDFAQKFQGCQRFTLSTIL